MADRADICPDCGRDRNVVGKMHRCVPIPGWVALPREAVPEQLEADAGQQPRRGSTRRKRDAAEQVKPEARVVLEVEQSEFNEGLGKTESLVQRVVMPGDPRYEYATPIGKPMPEPHPDCEHCKERLRRNAATQKRKRKSKA